MKVIRPTTITPAMLTSSTVAETDTYSSGTTYAAQAQVNRTTVHKVFESIAGGNLGHTPEGGPTFWREVGPTNRWKMFDRSVGTNTTDTGSMTIVLAPGAIDSLAIVDTDAVSATVTVTVGGVVIATRSGTTAAGGEVIDDWYRYFTSPVGVSTVMLFENLPVHPTGIVTVTITGSNPSGPVSVGTLIVGRMLDLGLTEQGVTASIADFSRKNTDDFGITTVVERSFSKRMTLRTLVMTAFVDGIQRELAKLRATPALWIGEDGFDSLTIYGFYKDFSLDLALANISYCSLTIEGLT